MRARLTWRRGVTSLLAMLYLVIFGTLAIGFYASTNTQSQIVANDERVARAFMASESGMDFMRYQLGRVYIPAGTAPANVLNRLYAELQTHLDDTDNLGPNPVSLSGNTIYVPGDGGYINLDSSGQAKFRATITDWLGEIVVKIDGQHGSMGATRAISMDFTRAARPINAFDYAVASKGKITMTGGTVTSVNGVDPRIATAMSALDTGESVQISGGTLGGDISVTGVGTANVTGGSVGGSSIPSVIMSDHVHHTDKPEFPEFDTSVFESFATTVRNSGANGNVTITNVRIPANTNPKFNGTATLQGILFIESPNKVEFKGDFKLNGFIVFEGEGDAGDNSLEFSGNLTQGPLPNSAEFDAMRSTSGVAILAPTAKILMTGAAKGNMRGSIISSKFETNGNPFDIVIDQGTLMTLDEGEDAMVIGSKTLRFTATGANNLPSTGMTYSTYYRPNPISYQEVAP